MEGQSCGQRRGARKDRKQKAAAKKASKETTCRLFTPVRPAFKTTDRLPARAPGSGVSAGGDEMGCVTAGDG